jgi:glyoxylase-like metal-dependent hydrolase (beta-lactamase superfamily II)
LAEITDMAGGVTKILLRSEGGVGPGSVNAYLLRSESGESVLVDTGYNSSGVVLVEALDALGANVQDVVLTHAHIDHIGGVEAVRRRFSPHLWMHTREAKGLAAVKRWVGGPHLAALRRQSTAFELGEILRILGAYLRSLPQGVRLLGGVTSHIGGWEVIHMPGHTPGHVCVYSRSSGILLSGDHVLPDTTTNIAYYPLAGYEPLREYLSSLVLVERLRPRLALPSHGGPITDLPGLVERLFRHHENRLLEVLANISTRSSLIEVSSGVSCSKGAFGELGPIDKWLALLEALAHIEFLKGVGIVVEEQPLVYSRRGGEAQQVISDALRRIRGGSA